MHAIKTVVIERIVIETIAIRTIAIGACSAEAIKPDVWLRAVVPSTAPWIVPSIGIEPSVTWTPRAMRPRMRIERDDLFFLVELNS
jgi:hypothetical protein